MVDWIKTRSFLLLFFRFFLFVTPLSPPPPPPPPPRSTMALTENKHHAPTCCSVYAMYFCFSFIQAFVSSVLYMSCSFDMYLFFKTCIRLKKNQKNQRNRKRLQNLRKFSLKMPLSINKQKDNIPTNGDQD